jgi:hypothetical protein
MKKFLTGQRYRDAYGCTYTVEKRTAKRLTISDQWGDQKTIGILIDEREPERGEWARPEGLYSQCPIIRAERPLD